MATMKDDNQARTSKVIEKIQKSEIIKTEQTETIMRNLVNSDCQKQSIVFCLSVCPSFLFMHLLSEVISLPLEVLIGIVTWNKTS